MATRPLYTVTILTARGWTPSRYFTRKLAAQRWFRWCAKTWPTNLYLGGIGECLMDAHPGPAGSGRN